MRDRARCTMNRQRIQSCLDKSRNGSDRLMPWVGEPGPAKRRWVIEGLHDCREERTEDGGVVHTMNTPPREQERGGPGVHRAGM